MVVVILLALLAQVAVCAFRNWLKLRMKDVCAMVKRIRTRIVELHGLPQSFESNISYNFSIQVSSQTITENTEGEIGGFRLMVTVVEPSNLMRHKD